MDLAHPAGASGSQASQSGVPPLQGTPRGRLVSCLASGQVRVTLVKGVISALGEISSLVPLLLRYCWRIFFLRYGSEHGSQAREAADRRPGHGVQDRDRGCPDCLPPTGSLQGILDPG